MQYIQKQEIQPDNWDDWFKTANGVRTFDYLKAQNNGSDLKSVREYLIKEQYYLCAYCQSKITIDNSSIEHVIPKSLNLELSTNYHNLVAVCKNQIKDENGRLHCDKEKGSLPIVPYIFYSNSDVNIGVNNNYFRASNDGSIITKDNKNEIEYFQIKSFVDILNLNHTTLKNKRKSAIFTLTSVYKKLSEHQKNVFWITKLNTFLANKSNPYRQFLLIYCQSKRRNKLKQQ
ncbi:MAG: TIGR02646 family protein [Bacteroidetes bacterium]|nr:MAG: TIGR02646 family protein [Bacteroidota bacterium]